MLFLSNSFEATAVVKLPPNGSSTTSPLFELTPTPGATVESPSKP